LGVEREKGVSDDFCYASSEYLRQAGYRSREREQQRFRLEKVVALAESSIPDFRKVVEAFWTTGSWAETAEMLSQRRCESVKRRIRRFGRNNSKSAICVT